MPRTPSLEPTIRAAVQQFTSRVASFVEAVTVQRIQSAILGNLGTPVRRGPGRPPKNAGALMASPLSLFTSVSPAKRRPKQLCPVPGCKNPAAPVFGMVCAEHKSVPKSKIKEYRQARRQARVKQAAASKGGARARGRGRAGAGKSSSKGGGGRSAKRGRQRATRAAAGRSAATGKKRPGRKRGPTPAATSSRPPAPANGANGAASAPALS